MDAAPSGNGLSIFEMDGADPVHLECLVALGGARMEQDDFGENRYFARLESINFGMQQRIDGVVYEVGHPRGVETHAASKLELLFALLDGGFAPINYTMAGQEDLVPSGNLVVVVSNALRSRAYFEVLLQLSSVWSRGAKRVSHHGSHSYYQCLLYLPDLSTLEAVGDVATTPDLFWAKILKGAKKLLMAPDALFDESEPIEQDWGSCVHRSALASALGIQWPGLRSLIQFVVRLPPTEFETRA